MLSRREREFLTNPEKFTGSYARWLRYSIKRKIRKTMQDLELISHTWPQALENLPTPLVNVRKHPNVENLISRERPLEKGVWGNLSPKTGPPGFEPGTPGLEGRCSIQAELRAHLRYSIAYLNVVSSSCWTVSQSYK